MPLFRRLVLVALLFGCRLASLPAQEISPLLVGNNLWHASRGSPDSTPPAAVMTLAGEAGIRLIRIGGREFDERMPSDATLLAWVARIRAIGAEPLIQVSQYQSAATAAATVAYLNLTHGASVRYWSIGNEPWLQANQAADAAGTARPSEAEIAATVEAYFKERAAAMKAVDPTIRIFGVDSENFQSGLHARLFGGANNIAGLVPGKTYYYCDGLSWHRYPQDAGIDPALEGLADIRSRIEACVARVAATNAALGRGGADALVWAVGEFNSKDGPAVHTWGNGQMFGGVYGLAMKHGAFFASAWSLRESGGARTATDFGLLDGSGLVPRPSYWHTAFVARHFTGRYLEGVPSVSDASSPLLVYGAEDPALEQVSVMILNRGATARAYTLHLNSAATYAAPGATALNVAADRPDAVTDTIPARATHVLVFRRDSLTRIAYAETDFLAGLPPVTTVTARSPVGAVLDDFDAYPALSAQGYWSPLHLGGATATLDSGRLVLRTTNTAYSTAALAGPVGPSLNFFARGLTVSIEGLDLSAQNVAAAAAHFRLSFNSSALRSFHADDSLALRLTPTEARLGFKLDQPGVQGEIRAGASAAGSALAVVPLEGAVRAAHLTLSPDPAGPASGVSTIHYTLRLDTSAGRVLRSGSFSAPAAAWGDAGASALVLECRREDAATGPAGTFVETRLDSVGVSPAAFDDFTAYASLDDQSLWQPLLVGANSTASAGSGSALLRARADAFASAALASPVLPSLNFFDLAYTLELRGLALASAGLAADESVFRLSLNSTAARSFTTPDSLTLRLDPDRVRLGLKLDQPSTDAEFRAGATSAAASLLDAPLPAPPTGLRLTLAPVGPAPAGSPATIFYALRLDTSAGPVTHAGSFLAERSRWGPAGDAALVLEARRNSGVVGDTASLMQAAVSAINYTPAIDDFFSSAPRYPAWQLRSFAFADLGVPALASATAAPAGDGVPNLLKYAVGAPPLLPLPPAFLSSAIRGPDGRLHLAHAERAGSELAYCVEASADLANWAAPVVELARSAPDPAGWIDVVTAADLPASAPRVFLRLRVAAP